MAGKWFGFSNTVAARYSFLMGIPVLFGATVRILMEEESRTYISDNFGLTVLGVAVSAVLGYVAIDLLLGIVKKLGLKPFGYYRIALAAILAVVLIVN